MFDEKVRLLERVTELEKQLLNTIAVFSHRDATMQAQVAALESANLMLSQQVAWFRGAQSGGGVMMPSAGSTVVQ